MNKKLSEKLREKGYVVGGRLLESKYLSWILFLFRKIGIVRMVHVVLDQIESRNATEEMLQFREIGKKNKKELHMVCQLFKEKKSRELYKDIFRYRCTKYRKYLIKHIEKDIYFNTLTMREKEEILIDGGAFNGDTIKLFCKKSRGRYKHIYAFETEEQNRAKMEKMIFNNQISEITIVPYAL